MGLCKVAKGDGDNKSSDVRVSRRCRNGGGPAAQVTGQRQGCLGGSKGGCGKQNKKEQSGASCWSSGVFCRNGGRCGTAPGESSTVNVRIKKETRAESGRRLPRGSAAQRSGHSGRSVRPPPASAVGADKHLGGCDHRAQVSRPPVERAIGVRVWALEGDERGFAGIQVYQELAALHLKLRMGSGRARKGGERQASQGG